MSMEIAIHRSVGQKRAVHSETHKQIVGFHGFFEDSDYIYILLELCRRRVSGENRRNPLFKIFCFILRSLSLYWIFFDLLILFLNNLYSGFQLHFFVFVFFNFRRFLLQFCLVERSWENYKFEKASEIKMLLTCFRS